MLIICLLIPYYVINILKPLFLPYSQTGINDWNSFDINPEPNQYKIYAIIDITSGESPNKFGQAKVSIFDIILPIKMTESQDNILCLDYVEFGGSKEIRSPESGVISFEQNNICSPLDSQDVRVTSDNATMLRQPKTFNTEIKVNPYYYPWDEYIVTIPFSVHYSESKPDGKYELNAAPDLALTVYADGWKPSYKFYKIDKITGELSNTSEQSILQISFKRISTQRILPAILLGVVLAFSVMIVFVRDSSSAIEISVGILFSLWGTRSILVPPNLTEPIFIDVLILSEYLLLACFIVIRFTIRPIIIWAYNQLKIKNIQNTIDINGNNINIEDESESAFDKSASSSQPIPKEPSESYSLSVVILAIFILLFKRK